MIDPDISTEDARRLLTVDERDDSPLNMDRRRFLQLVGWGVGAGALVGGLGESFAPQLMSGRMREAYAATPIGAADGIVVLLGFDGGLDGLNTVVPYTDANYYAQHGTLAVPAAQVLQLNGTVGLNPNLTYLKSLYDKGEVAVVQGVGYPNPDLSHFSSMALWMYGKAGNGTPTTGWVGRWLDGLGGDDLFRAVSVGQSLPLSLVGDVKRGTAVPSWGLGFGSGTDVHDQWMYDAMRGMSSAPSARGQWHDTVATTLKGVVDVGQQLGPVFSRTLPDDDIVKKMTVAARLINADLGLRVIDTSFSGFDTHSSQPGSLTELLTSFDAAIKAFFTTLDDRFRSRVTIVTYSEFGRTSWSNDSDGTDHGTVNNHFVIGQAVKGGLYGQQPSLVGLRRWDRPAFNIDFRSLYTSILDGWLGGGASTVIGGSYSNLGLFKTGPGAGVATGSGPAAALGDFTGVTPYRLYDSRYQNRFLPLGAGTTGEVQATGIGGVPAAGVTAVALNVTTTAATGDSAFTVWPTGEARPNVSNVIVPVARAVPNLTIVKVGQGGRVNVFNDQATAQCIVDVVGWFGPATATRLQPITPVRALDTRNGTGGKTGPLGPNGTYDVLVRGVGGVPAGADSVVLNVTAVRPSSNGWMTVWPSGQAKPNASCLNFVAGQIVPNSVIAKIGSNGKVSINNANGYTNVVVDILGYMSSTAPGRHFPLAPARLLDTRPDNVAPIGANSTTTITVTGVGGVPASGVSAVALNIAAYNPSVVSYLTLYPNGEARPNTSNLNTWPGRNVSNLAIVKVGSQGKVALYNYDGTVDLVVDVVGWFST